jgi:hypothetical protein
MKPYFIKTLCFLLLSFAMNHFVQAQKVYRSSYNNTIYYYSPTQIVWQTSQGRTCNLRTVRYDVQIGIEVADCANKLWIIGVDDWRLSLRGVTQSGQREDFLRVK